MKGGGERRDLFKRATVNRGTKEHPRVEWCRRQPHQAARRRGGAHQRQCARGGQRRYYQLAAAAAFIGVAIESFSIWKLTEQSTIRLLLLLLLPCKSTVVFFTCAQATTVVNTVVVSIRVFRPFDCTYFQNVINLLFDTQQYGRKTGQMNHGTSADLTLFFYPYASLCWQISMKFDPTHPFQTS